MPINTLVIHDCFYAVGASMSCCSKDHHMQKAHNIHDLTHY